MLFCTKRATWVTELWLPSGVAGETIFSPDGKHYWTGSEWLPVPSSAPTGGQEPEVQDEEPLRFYWPNLFSVRVWILSVVTATIALMLFVVAAGAAGVEDAAWMGPVSRILLFGLIGLQVLLAAFLPPASCRACGKRMKIGFDTCHHCGYVSNG